MASIIALADDDAIVVIASGFELRSPQLDFMIKQLRDANFSIADIVVPLHSVPPRISRPALKASLTPPAVHCLTAWRGSGHQVSMRHPRAAPRVATQTSPHRASRAASQLLPL
jgi:hypothetical protein